MTAKSKALIFPLDRMLFRKGFVDADIRMLVRNQILLAGFSSAFCLVVLGLSAWAWSYCAGAVLVTVNFWFLAEFGRRVASSRDKAKAVVSTLFRFYLRLGLTGVALYALLVWAGARPVALLAGVSIIVVNFLCWGAARVAASATREAPNGKEA
ncbi:ATP synthase subunit I [Desulfolutivibrio sulfoxidireducens]|nr:ATP synthase subunit I [Desulfolutivibrio sulfoxidireducens]